MRNMTELDAAYFAGLMDGEGWITIHKRTYKKTYYYLYCGIKMTDPRALEALKEIIDARIAKYTKPRANTKDTYQINLYGDNVKDFLAQVYPYMLIKKEHASIALQFPGKDKKGKGIDEDRVMFYEVIKRLNGRGRDV